MPDTSAAAARFQSCDVLRQVAHELRQPLSTIESIAYYLDIILPDTEPRAREQAGKLQQMVHQCNRILADAIHFLQAAPPRKQLLDLAELIGDALAERPDQDGSWLRYEPAEQLPPVLLDAAQARHMLGNLITFFQQAARGGTVLVKTHAAGGRVCLELSAPAPGYNAESLGALFEPFSPHSAGGSGLALASVRRVAEAHGAALEAGLTPEGELQVRIEFL